MGMLDIMEPVKPSNKDDLVTALQQELLLYQQHAKELVSTAAEAIGACQDELFREQEQHEETKAELRNVQAQLHFLQSLRQRLKVCASV
jgi:hypothetical protein